MNQIVTYRDSMQSESVLHYELATDLGPDEIKRRLRGSWLDRYRKSRSMRSYHRWERKRRASR
jgi:hypothetical protein